MGSPNDILVFHVSVHKQANRQRRLYCQMPHSCAETAFPDRFDSLWYVDATLIISMP